MKVWLAFLIVLFCYSGAVASGDELTEKRLEQFLASRVVVATIQFPPDSSKLDATAKAALNLDISSIKDFDLKQKVLRVEGLDHFEGTSSNKLDLSIRRVKAVEDYLRNRHQLMMDRYLVGFGPSGSSIEQNQVEIVLYDNIWGLDQTGIETVTSLQK